MKRFVADTSSIIDGKLRELIEKNKIKGELIIPGFVISELENQANKGKEIGFRGLEELKTINQLAIKKKIKIASLGRMPTMEEIHLAKSGRIDALIRDIARDRKATLITADLVQAKVAEAEKVDVIYFEKEKIKKIPLERYFDKHTMSVHLKEGVRPKAKRGKPGNFKLVNIGKNILKKEELEKLSTEIMDVVRISENGFVEMGKYGATVVQLGTYRIAITRRPFSEKMEITAVRPIVKLKLSDYKLSTKLKQRLDEKAESILIAGPPGAGKSSFAAALAEFYSDKGRVVKTLENPRDLQVGPEITQYGPLERDMSKTADILLLVRPDFSVYDELRKTSDFRIYSDLRLAGIGLIGVTHASEPVDAIQRFIGRVDLGVIPQIIDTIVFIKAGKIEKIYSLRITVRVPSGMTESDLARPIVDIIDFETNKLEYEIYTYGDQTVIIPSKQKASPLRKLAGEKIKKEMFLFDKKAEVEFVSDQRVVVRVSNEVVPRLIGKEGKRIKEIENRLGVSIDVQPFTASFGKEIKFNLKDTGAYVVISFKKNIAGKNANVYIGKEYLFSATVGRQGQIKISKDSDIGNNLIIAKTNKKNIKVFI